MKVWLDNAILAWLGIQFMRLLIVALCCGCIFRTIPAADARKIKRVSVREIKDVGLAMAEQDHSGHRLSMEIELDADGDEHDEYSKLQLTLHPNLVLLTKGAQSETYTGTVSSSSGNLLGPCAITFGNPTRTTFQGLLGTEKLQKISETDVSQVKHKKNIHCGTHYEQHAITQMFGKAEPLFDFIFKKQKEQSSESEDHGEQVAKCLNSRHYIYLGVAADCEFVKRAGGHEKARALIIKTYNEVSMMYQKAFNVAIGIIELVVPEDKECSDLDYLREKAPSWNGPCMPTNSLSPILAEFTKWRARERKDDEAGLWHLLTGCRVEGSEVGLGWIDTLGVRSIRGRHQRSVGGTAVSTLEGRSLTEVVGHELGHNLGASHDCAQKCSCQGITCRDCCPCPSDASPCDCKGKYLMNPTTNMASLDFSPCTINQICASLRLRPNHLHSESAALTRVNQGGAVCGNGVKEEGEECDCGTEEECAKDPCCQSGCKLRKGAECSDRHGGGCCQSCKIVREQKVCRSAKSFCDFEERCDGVSGQCPRDRFKPDGTACPSLSADLAPRHCASGMCTSRDDQCRIGAARFHALDYCPALNVRSACQLHCRVPTGIDEQTECMQLASMLIDGTKCGERGLCRQGICVEGGVVSPHAMRSLVLLAAPLSAIVLLTICIHYYFS